MSDNKIRVWVTGHKSPDTDSICSAIAYANLKNTVDESKDYFPGRAGDINEETRFVLDYFGADEPELIVDVRQQLSDVEFHRTTGVDKNISIKEAWETMKKEDMVTLPVTEGDELDGVVTIISLPALLTYFTPALSDYSFIIAFRALRVFKLFRTARRFPNLKEIWMGFRLALRQSAAFLLGYFVIIVVVAMFNCALFGKAAPEYFSTPLDGIYSMFQMFTVEGWYEIPNAVAGSMPPVWLHIVRTYFCLLLFGGGIIGMSLINSIFVDALAADNNDDVKAKLDQLEKKLDTLQQLLEKSQDNK